MLSSTSEYALRALSCLAEESRGKVLLGRDLSARTAVPPTYLSKILLALRDAGIVEATRGSGGGYSLARPARSVSLMEVVELFERDKARPGCILGHSDGCSERHPCPAYKRWVEVRASYIEFLETTTLADIARSCKPPKGRSSR